MYRLHVVYLQFSFTHSAIVKYIVIKQIYGSMQIKIHFLYFQVEYEINIVIL